MSSDQSESTEKTDTHNSWETTHHTTYLGLLLGTKKGKAILAMGVIHTVIVAGCLTAAYFFTGIKATFGMAGVYTVLVSINTYINNKEKQLTLKTTLVFIILIPLTVTLFTVAGYEILT